MAQGPNTRIIDVNDDCLRKISQYLDLHNFFNVAIANEYLRPAAAEVYKHKYGEKDVNIHECDDYRRRTRSSTRVQPTAED